MTMRYPIYDRQTGTLWDFDNSKWSTDTSPDINYYCHDYNEATKFVTCYKDQTVCGVPDTISDNKTLLEWFINENKYSLLSHISDSHNKDTNYITTDDFDHLVNPSIYYRTMNDGDGRIIFDKPMNISYQYEVRLAETMTDTGDASYVYYDDELDIYKVKFVPEFEDTPSLSSENYYKAPEWVTSSDNKVTELCYVKENKIDD